MTQEDIFNHMKRYKTRWMTAAQLAYELNMSQGSAQANLRKMRNHNECEFRYLDPINNHKGGMIQHRYKEF